MPGGQNINLSLTELKYAGGEHDGSTKVDCKIP